jgi:subtilisin family serine protease
MSEYKEYTVTTESLELTDAVWDALLTEGSNLTTIPIRAVEVANERPENPLNTSYWLTDREAEFLRQDPRVSDVQDLSIFKPQKLAFQTGTFDKTTNETGPKVNWGLLRHSKPANVYGTSLLDPGGTYDYVLDGSNVDVVIIDSGIQANHPEFLYPDGSGASRVNLVDWFAVSGVSGSMPSGFYQDYDGHGTHVAATVAGLNFGWAKNARIYSIKLEGLKAPSDPGSGFDVDTAFDVLIGWHNNKTNGRPTVVVNSWGYGVFHRADLEAFSFGLDESETLYAINGGAYRGVTWEGTVLDTAKGHTGALVAPSTYRYPFRVAAVDADIRTGAEAGILFVNAAGNEYIKIDVQGGIDYNNYITTDFGAFTYHRGGTPGASITARESVFTVGSIDHQTVTGTSTERKSNFSNSGPGVTVYAAGSRIMSAMSQVNDDNSNYPYFLNGSFKQQLLSGTSMAAPQIAGIAALVYQMHPDWTPRQVINFIKDKSFSSLFKTDLTNDYTNVHSVHGGANLIAYVPMASQRKFSFQRATV